MESLALSFSAREGVIVIVVVLGSERNTQTDIQKVNKSSVGGSGKEGVFIIIIIIIFLPIFIILHACLMLRCKTPYSTFYT